MNLYKRVILLMACTLSSPLMFGMVKPEANKWEYIKKLLEQHELQHEQRTTTERAELAKEAILDAPFDVLTMLANDVDFRDSFLEPAGKYRAIDYALIYDNPKATVILAGAFGLANLLANIPAMSQHGGIIKGKTAEALFKHF